ncbi:MAG: hypothetical protein WCT32_01380 [Patescibacteria group bacterium]
MRDDSYLQERLQIIWERHFPDVPRPNDVQIRFGRKAKKRLGSICSRGGNDLRNNFDTQILINGHFQSKKIPEYVIDATIAHELCHYTHGFSSPLPRRCLHPHKGGVVEKELERRGISHWADDEWKWLQNNWKTTTNIGLR